MRGGKRIVDVQIAKPGHRGHQCRIVLFFTLVKAGVFQNRDRTGRQRGHRTFRLGTGAIGDKADRAAEHRL